MQDSGQRSIFRIEAMRRNLRGSDEAILPQFSSPKIIWLLWTFIALSLAGGVLLWFMRIPIYTAAIAIPLAKQNPHAGPATFTVNNNDEPLMAVLIPSRHASQVRVGQRVLWRFSKTGERAERKVIEVRPAVQSPDSLHRELELRGPAAASVTGPAAIALVKLGPVPDDLPASTYAGSVFQAEVEVGTRRVISLFPVLGRYIGN